MQAVTFFIAFVAVLALIGVAAWLVRRFASSRLGTHTNRGRMPRLAVIDAAAVDGRRRLVLVRRDNIEHLLMIGGPTDIVVESNIVRATASRDQISQRAAASEPPPRIAPLPEPNWADAEARAEASDSGEPQMPEQPPRPVRPSFAEEMRRPAHAERRAEPLAGLTPEPIGGRQERLEPRPEPRSELRPEPRLEPRPEPMHGRASARGEPIVPRPSRQSDAPKAPAVRAAAPPPPPNADQNLAEMAQRLEAALRRPAGTETVAPSVAPESPQRERATPRTEPSAAPPASPPSPKSSFENLEDEMASLLGRSKSPS